ncbi:MAG TPA: ATP-binding protein [Tepidisphaeraceae bacterium]|nr:ATP-binding protein [Tepidisphaeraceae bacterium]
MRSILFVARAGVTSRVLPAVVLLWALIGVTAPAGGATPERPRRVVVLHDENKDFSGLALLDQSIKDALKAGIPSGLEVHTEYLDVSRFHEPGHDAVVGEFFRRKYAGRQIDVVITVMAPSLDFVTKFGGTSWPGAAVVFCGIDRRELDGRTLGPNVTGVLVKREFKPTLELALRLHPGTRNVVFVAGTSPFNRYWTEQARAELREFESRVTIRNLTDLPLESIRDEVSRLPEHSVVLYLHLFRDGAGRTFSPNEAMSLIAERANAPIYVFLDQYVGLGGVGGWVYSFEVHGTRAGETAVRVLRGERPKQVSVTEASSSLNLFDARQLKRWGVAESALPAGAVVRFPDVSFWARYRWHVAGACAVIVTQAMLIFAMFVQLRRRRAADAARRVAEADAHQRRTELAHVSRAATLGELTATLAHELSQPLAAVLNNAGAGQRFLANGSPDLAEVRAALADIAADATRASEVIGRLRGMLKRGTTVAAFEPVDLNDVVRTVERLVHGDGVAHRVAVELDLAADLPPTAGDAIQLQQVVMNLMLNAFAAIDQPGRLVRRLVVRTRVVEGGSGVEAEFADSGSGISADVIDRLFEPFVTTKAEGLGMGLSICRSIVDQHGGRLRAENSPAGGATFTLTLPSGSLPAPSTLGVPPLREGSVGPKSSRPFGADLA